METVTVRPMTRSEFDRWQTALAEEYAGEQVAAGRWPSAGALQRARDENSALLPHGMNTPRMLLLQGIGQNGDPVGHAWVALDHPRGRPE